MTSDTTTTSTTTTTCCGCCASHAWILPQEPPPLVADHQSKGRYITLPKEQKIFVRDQGPKDGIVVVMVHGVPSSSLLYRKFFPPLVAKGYRAIAMDLPGLGLSDKPNTTSSDDYSWPQLAETLGQILDHSDLGLANNNHRKIHLVIHDIGGPIAGLWASQNQERVAGITVLDTLWDVQHFSKPFPMNIFPLPLIGSIALATLTPWMLRHFMYWRGVDHNADFDHDEAVAWVWLLNHQQGAKSFATIMKSFPKTVQEKTEVTQRILELANKNDNNKPRIQIVWADHEKAIPKSQCDYIQEKFHVAPENVHSVPGGHFLQLESADLIVDKIHAFIISSERN